MLQNDVRNKLYKELELQLDNKQFFNAKDYYNSSSKVEENINKKSFSSNNISYARPLDVNKSYDYTNTIKGISFSNKLETNKKIKSVDDLSLEERKIYKISDLLSANLEKTIIIPYNVMPASLSLVKRFD